MDDEEKDRAHLLAHPHLQAFDKLCSSTNTEDNVCTITDKQVRFTHDVYYTTTKSIVMDAAKVKCLTTSYAPCTLHLFMAGDLGTFLTLKNGSTLQGK